MKKVRTRRNSSVQWRVVSDGKKAWLVACFIDRTEAPPKGSPNANKLPWELYEGYFTEEQWAAFEDYVRFSEEFEVKRERRRKNSKFNIHRHILRQKSYSRKRIEWIKEERLLAPTGEGASACKERLTNRALEWCLAHQKRMKDGKWEVDPNKPETARVVKRVMEELEKGANEKERGTSDTPEKRGVDALTKALGKKDHRGYVKALGRSGVGVGHLQAFGKVDRKREKAKEREEFEKRIEEKVEERLQE